MGNRQTQAPQIVGQAKETYDKLPSRLRTDIDDWLEDRPNQVLYGRYDVMAAWLEWNGIIGYDYDIMAIFHAMETK